MNKLFCSCYNLPASRPDQAGRLRFLERIRHEAGASGLRVFALQLWGTEARRLKDVHYLPKDLPWVNRFLWHGFNRAGVQCEIAPMVDFTQLNMEWWNRRAELLRKMAELGLELDEVALDYCSMKDMWDERADGPDPRPNKFWNPWLSNVQFWRGEHIPKFDEEPGWGGLWQFHEDGPWKWFFEFVRQLIYTGQEILGDKYNLESWNEFAMPGESKEHAIEWCRRFHERILTETNLKKEHLKFSGSFSEEIEKQVGIVCFHGHARPESIKDNYGIEAHRVQISGDGGTDGDGRQDDMGNAGMSIQQATQMATYMIELGYPTYEAFDFGIEALPAGHEQADVDQFEPVAFRAFAETFLRKDRLWVCVETGFLANEYCYDVTPGEFVPGTKPAICGVHKKPGPPEPPFPPPHEKCRWWKQLKSKFGWRQKWLLQLV